MKHLCPLYSTCPDIQELNSGKSTKYEDLCDQHEELCTQGGICKTMKNPSEEFYSNLEGALKQGVRK
jgi:hypothetical protein